MSTWAKVISTHSLPKNHRDSKKTMTETEWPGELKKGDWVSRTSYMKILNREPGGLKVTNESGFEWIIASNIIENECEPAFGYKDISKVTQSELTRLLVEETRGAVVSLNFTKKQTTKRILEMIEGADLSKMDMRAKNKFANNLMVGEPRNLIGYVIDADANGRIRMVDLNVEGDNRMRLVDPRTLADVTFRGTCYQKK